MRIGLEQKLINDLNKTNQKSYEKRYECNKAETGPKCKSCKSGGIDSVVNKMRTRLESRLTVSLTVKLANYCSALALHLTSIKPLPTNSEPNQTQPTLSQTPLALANTDRTDKQTNGP